MSLADGVVGGIAILLGAACLIAGLVPVEVVYRLPKVAWLERQVGRGLARLACGLLGLSLIAWGVALACGWRWAGR